MHYVFVLQLQRIDRMIIYKAITFYNFYLLINLSK